MKISTILLSTAVVVGLQVLSVNASQADDVTDAIDAAVKSYKEGQSQQTITQLELATQLVRQQRATEMEKVLPEPLSGWTAEAPESASVGAAMFGGGSTIKRTYNKGDESITIEIVSDSPMLQSMMGLLTNPMFGAASQGGKIQMLNGQQAVVKKDSIMMVVDNAFLVNVNGAEGLDKEMLDYAKAIDLKKLVTFK